jgi:hypothetical protein
MIRQAMWRRVELAARDDIDGLYAVERASVDLTDPPLSVVMERGGWDKALGAYWEDHAEIGTDADARGPHHLHIAPDPDRGRVWQVRQTLADPRQDHDWVIEAEVDLDATDAVGELVLRATALRRL